MIDTVPQLLDESQARFITERVAINVGSCNAERQPSVTRAYGCRVATDRSRVTVFVIRDYATQVLEDLRAGKGIAAVFTRPSTHETMQLKGLHAEVDSLDAGDRDLMRAYGQDFQAELADLGCQDPFLSAMVAPSELEAVALTFTPIAAFEQTPGPNAGLPLGARS